MRDIYQVQWFLEHLGIKTMALEKKPIKQMIAEMSARQKMILGSFILIFLILIWQVKGLFSGGGGVTQPVTTAATGKAVSSTGMSASSPVSAGQVVEDTQIKQAPAPVEGSIFQVEKETEQKYLSKLNELEQLKIQREIAETNQAIAAARLQTVTAEKNMSDLLTKPTPTVTMSEYASGLVNPVKPGETIAAPGMKQPTMVSLPIPAEAPYTVISVSMQLEKWNAVVGFQGKLFNVSVGDILPVDGSEVVSIDKEGVELRKEDKTRKLSLVSAI